jgi:hypothetical protein
VFSTLENVFDRGGRFRGAHRCYSSLKFLDSFARPQFERQIGS